MPKSKQSKSSRMVRKMKCGEPGCKGHDVQHDPAARQAWKEAQVMVDLATDVCKAACFTIEMLAPPEVRCAMAVDVGGKLMLTGIKNERNAREQAKLLREMFAAMGRELSKMGINFSATVTERDRVV